MLQRCLIVSERTYHALRLETCVCCTQSYESTFILKMKNTFKWNVNLLGVAYRRRSYLIFHLDSNKQHFFLLIYLVLHIATTNGDFTIWEELQTLSLKRKNDALFYLTILTHTQSLKLWCAPIACEFHILWIFTFCNILHVTINLKELIAHNTATKSLRIIHSLGSSQIQSSNSAACFPQQIWHTADFHTRNTFFVTTSEELVLHNDTK